MLSHKGITYDRIISLLIKLFIVICLFFPFVTKEGKLNDIFILSNFICLLIILLCLFKKNVKQFNRSFLVLYGFSIIIYNIVCGIYNFNYHHYFIEQINKDISFFMLIILIMKIDKNFLIRYKIINFLTGCIVVTVLLSIIYFFIGGEAVSIENFHIYFSKQGTFDEKRLTWLFGHKSSYALFLILFLNIFVRYRKFFKQKILYIIAISIIIVTIIISGSFTALTLTFVTILFIILGEYDLKRRYAITIVLLPVFSLAAYCIYKYIYIYILQNRDITTLGMRTYIYRAAALYLGVYPQGIGKLFGNLLLSYDIMTVDNLHNIFLNEMLRFSIPVGIIYTIIFLIICVYSIIKNKIWAIGIWISCFVLFFMDYSLRTELLSLFIFLIYLLFFVDFSNQCDE